MLKEEYKQQALKVLTNILPKIDGKPVPLKIGVHKELCKVARTYGLTSRLIRAALRRYCSQPDYLRSLIDRPFRHNLDGSELISDPITEYQKEIALADLSRMDNK